MQLMNFFHVITSFLMGRIPNSGLLDMSGICEKENYLQFLLFISLAAVYAKNLVTISFCLTRVFVLYMEPGKEVVQFLYLTFSVIPLAFLLALPRTNINATCTTRPPFPQGSVVITSYYGLGEGLNNSQIIEAIFYPTVIFIIIILNLLMFLKLWKTRKLSLTVRRKYDRKAEKSLSITMVLIILPVVVNCSIAILNLFNYFNFFLYLIRPWMIDARCHIIVIYFYYNHPIFRKSQITRRMVTKLKTKEIN